MATDLHKKIFRPYAKQSDILPIAWILTALLLIGGQKAGQALLRIPSAAQRLDSLAGSPDAGGSLGMLAGSAGVWILFICLIIFWRPDRPMLRAVTHNRAGNTLKLGLLGLLAGLGLCSLCVLVPVILGDLRLDRQGVDLLPMGLFLIAVIIWSGGEELAARCFLYQKLRRRYRHPAMAILGSSLFAAALRLISPDFSLSLLAQVTVTGLLLSLVIYYWGSFWACWGLRTGWYFAQWILFGLPCCGQVCALSLFRPNPASPGGSPFWDAGSGIEGSILAVLLMVWLCITVIVCGTRSGRREDLWREAAGAYETV